VPAAVAAAVDLLVTAGRDARLSDELLLDMLRARLRKG
jgi:GntR family transcriptional regulator